MNLATDEVQYHSEEEHSDKKNPIDFKEIKEAYQMLTNSKH